MVAGFVTPSLEVEAVDGVDVGVVFPVQLLPSAAVNSHLPQREHLIVECKMIVVAIVRVYQTSLRCVD